MGLFSYKAGCTATAAPPKAATSLVGMHLLHRPQCLTIDTNQRRVAKRTRKLQQGTQCTTGNIQDAVSEGERRAIFALAILHTPWMLYGGLRRGNFIQPSRSLPMLPIPCLALGPPPRFTEVTSSPLVCSASLRACVLRA